MRSAAPSLEKECQTLREKAEKSASALTEAEKKVSDLSAELSLEKKKNADLTEETNATMASLCEELADAASHYTWRTKARLMKQFMEGKTASWTPEADVKQFLEVFGTPEDLLPKDANVADTMATADSAVNVGPTDVVWSSSNFLRGAATPVTRDHFM